MGRYSSGTRLTAVRVFSPRNKRGRAWPAARSLTTRPPDHQTAVPGLGNPAVRDDAAAGARPNHLLVIPPPPPRTQSRERY